MKNEFKTFIGQVVKGSREGSFQINVPRKKTLLKIGDYVKVENINLKDV